MKAKTKRRKVRECWVWWNDDWPFDVHMGERRPQHRKAASEEGVIYKTAGRWILMREVRRAAR